MLQYKSINLKYGGIISWHSRLLMTASLVALALLSVPLKLSLRLMASTRSMLTFASTAVHAQIHAL